MHSVICVGNSILYLVTVSAKGAYCISVPAFHQFKGVIEQDADLSSYQLVFSGISGRQREEVIVDVFLAHFVDALQVI